MSDSIPTSNTSSELLGTSADSGLSARIRRALWENWTELGQGAAETWDAGAMWQAFDARRISAERVANAAYRQRRERNTMGVRDARYIKRSINFSRASMVGRRLDNLAGLLLGAIVVGAGVFAWGKTSPQEHVERYMTGIGEQRTVTLHDGTRVTLASRSRLEVARGFGTSARDVQLVGEAYFDVPHADGLPFVVHTGAIQTRVLGTAFDVLVDSARCEVRVVVIHGKVSSGHAQTVVAAAGSIAYVADSTASAVMTADATQYTMWMQGQVRFHDAPVRDVLNMLGRWYGLDFRVADSALHGQHVTAAFDTRSQENALTVLKGVLDASMTFEQRGDRMVVTVTQRHDRKMMDRRANPALDLMKHDGLLPSLHEVGR